MVVHKRRGTDGARTLMQETRGRSGGGWHLTPLIIATGPMWAVLCLFSRKTSWRLGASRSPIQDLGEGADASWFVTKPSEKNNKTSRVTRYPLTECVNAGKY